MRRPRKRVSSKASRWKTSMGVGIGSGGVVREVFGVGEADGAVGAKEHGVGVETEAEVGIALPVLKVVARRVRRGCEVGDFVLREAVLREVRAGGLVELGGEFVGGNAVGVEALAAGEDFAAEAGVFVNLEHVDAEVGEADAGGDVERVLPGGRGLVGEAGDEVGADVGYAGGLEAKDLVDAVALGMAAADGGALAIDEGLHAERDAIDALLLGLGEDGIGDLAGCGFEGDLGGGCDLEGLAEGGEDAAKLGGLEQAGGSSAEVEGVDGGGESGVEARGGERSGGDLVAELGDVGFDGRGRGDTGGKVAEAAFRAAEGYGDVDA